MKKTELSRGRLVGATLWVLTVMPITAQAQDPATPQSPRSKGSPLSARPAHMPCKVVERYGRPVPSPNIDTVYAMHYRRDGLPEKATHRVLDNDCRTLSACRFVGGEIVDLEYRHDDQGRLVEVTAPIRGERLTVTYDGGRPYHYHHTREQDGVQVAENDGRITLDSAGRPSASIERAWITIPGGRGRMTTTSRFSGMQEPFASEPTVWPYAPEKLFVGWTRRFSTTTTLGTRDREPILENEVVTYDEQGRIRRVVLAIDFQGRTIFTRDFVYDCPAEKPGPAG